MVDERGVGAHRVEEILESSLESVDRAEEIVVQQAREMGFSEDEQHHIGVALRECMVNAIVHGNQYNARKKVHLVISRTPRQLEVRISDEGGGFDPGQLPDPLAEENLLRQSGRGVMMMQAFMDEFEVRRRHSGGTEVRMVKYLPETA